MSQALRVQSDWVRAYSAANPMEAELLVGLLRQRGIDAGLRSQGLMGGIGELPMDALHTPVWVMPSQLAAARSVLEDYEAQGEQAPWTCSECSEINEASFEFCWQCGQNRV
ncbi:DUF2007 domain-containing protein [Aliidiomarina sp. Khilg15.8]